LANEDLLEAEWLDIYQYLLAQLANLGFNDIRSEIEAAASAPVVEESTPEDQAQISKMVRSEVGRAIIRRRSPEEVFSAAIGVLQSRLVELPAVAASLAGHLGTAAARVEFRVDYEYRYALVESEPVPLDHLTVDGAQAETIRRDLIELGAVDRRKR
jgi:hypothetical protein